MVMHAPGNSADLDQGQLQKWTARLSQNFAAEISGTRTIPNPDHPRAWFFDAAAQGLAGTITKDIDWTAYPKRMKAANWATVDEHRNLQEEYCEWEVVRNDAGKVVRVTFSTETQDYFDFLWNNSQAKLLELYQKHVSPLVKLQDLGVGGQYNPQNAWNWPGQKRGALMHMAQPNNTLGAAINLAARATWPIINAAGVPLTSEQDVIASLKFGDPARHSDPHIGAQINELVRSGNEVSFADPVGLYIHEIDLTDFQTPDGSGAAALVRQTRGESGFSIRALIEAPAGANYVLGDVMIEGQPIRYGSQIAEKIRVRIRGAAKPAAQHAPQLKVPGFSVVGQADLLLGAGPPASPVKLSAQGSSRLSSVEHILAPE